MPITGMPRPDRNAIVSAMRTPPSSFTAPHCVSFMIRTAELNACSLEASYEPNGISTTTSACFEPRITAAP